jgi:LysR family hydrogen peroxide-inducible transcriptional activator
MNIRDLKYLVALADEGHFGRAAELCFVSQPALSMQIMKLEESLGIKLLERTNKSVLLTDQGALIVNRARHILHQVEEVREIARSAKDPFSGELRIGIFPTLAPYLLPLIIPKLSKRYPNLSFYLIEEQTSVLIEKLKQGKLHAALLAHPVIEKSFSHALLFEEEFLLATPIAHALAKIKKVKQQDLQHQYLLLLEEGHCMRDQALAVCHEMRGKEAPNFRATSLETLRNMVAAGVGITLMPKLACNENEDIAYVPFALPKPVRSIALFWRTALSKEIVLKEIVIEIRKIMLKQKTVKVLHS